MHLTTDYVTAAINGYRFTSLTHSALPDAPVVPDPEREPFISRISRRVSSAARVFASSPPPAPSSEPSQAQT